MNRRALMSSAAACVLALLAVPGANAEDHRGPPRHEIRHHPPFRGDIHRFHEHDWSVWRGGHWVHGPHAGRRGWWWVVGGLWYFYPSPVYPYPSPWVPPAVELVTPSPNAPPPPTQYWYWCESAQKYYPYVASCPGGWREVPATPTPAQ